MSNAGQSARNEPAERSEFIIFLEPARPAMVDAPTPKEASIVEAHFGYLQTIAERGDLVLAGRTLEPPHTGIVILRAADRAEAQSILDEDPAIRAGIFKARLQSYRVAIRAEYGEQ